MPSTYRITGLHIEITPALRDKIVSCLDKVTKNRHDVTDVKVSLSIEKKHIHKAEATIQVKGHSVHAEQESSSMYEAIDKLEDKLSRQLKKHSEKSHDHHPDQGKVINHLDDSIPSEAD